MSKSILTLLVGFSRDDRYILEKTLLATDNCVATHPSFGTKEINDNWNGRISKVIINSSMNFKYQYTKWYLILKSLNIDMFQVEISSDSKTIIKEQVNGDQLFREELKFDDDVCQLNRFQDSFHLLQRLIDNTSSYRL